MDIYTQLGLHFARHDSVLYVSTGSITIGKETYPAASYIERCAVPPGCPAYDRGEREYTRHMIYCVGKLPSKARRGHVAFRMQDDAHDWYVAAYYGNVKGRVQETAEPNDYHPFGNAFMLAPWDPVDGVTIDAHARVPYPRQRITAGANWIVRKEYKA